MQDSEIVEENNYYPFGLKHKVYNNVINGTHHPYGFGGKEEQDELGLGWIDITARNYDPALGRWMNVDPLASKMPGISPYAFSANNPIFFIDPDGREPIPWYRRWFGAKRTASQWYSSAGVYDATTFNSASNYNTKNLNARAYQGVYQRNAYYGWAQSQANAKGLKSKWFGAAELVTGLRGVGGTELPNLWVIKDNTEAFLKGGNKFLFSHNMKNAKGLLSDGKLSGGFTDANGKSQSFKGLSGMALDNKMVEFEQSKVQEYINNYKGDDLNSIITNINQLMQNPLGPGDVKSVMEKSFKGGTFNFKSYKDRVKLGQELIKKAHNE